jgi:hypothetical protein
VRRAVPSFLLLGALVGCSSAGSATDLDASASPSASSTLADPVTACTTQLTYWAGEMLRGAPDHGGDYQHMGLTSTSYEELLALVANARQQPSVSEEWLTEQAGLACQRVVAARATATSAWP